MIETKKNNIRNANIKFVYKTKAIFFSSPGVEHIVDSFSSKTRDFMFTLFPMRNKIGMCLVYKTACTNKKKKNPIIFGGYCVIYLTGSVPNVSEYFS